MSRYYIEEARFGEGNGGAACGPVEGPVVAEVKIKDEHGKELYVSMCVVMGFPGFLKSDIPLYDDLVNMDSDMELNQYEIGIGDYPDLFERKGEDDLYEVYRYLMMVMWTSEGEKEEYIKKTVEHYIDEIDIPATSIEEDYYEELAYMEEDHEESEDMNDSEDENDSESGRFAIIAQDKNDNRIICETGTHKDSLKKLADAFSRNNSLDVNFVEVSPKECKLLDSLYSCYIISLDYRDPDTCDMEKVKKNRKESYENLLGFVNHITGR